MPTEGREWCTPEFAAAWRDLGFADVEEGLRTSGGGGGGGGDGGGGGGGGGEWFPGNMLLSSSLEDLRVVMDAKGHGHDVVEEEGDDVEGGDWEEEDEEE